nr:hypothetical protein [Tanacetum cinerariifolium]
MDAVQELASPEANGFCDSPLLGVNTPRSDEDRLKLMELMVFLETKECVIGLSNEEIFTGLARMGYEKPSTKLTFYKAFFSTQWKFFIHTILHSLSTKRTSWNEFSLAMASAVICLSSEAQVPAQGDDVQEPAAEEVVTDVVPTTPIHHHHHLLSSHLHLLTNHPVEGLENDKAAQQLEIVTLKARVKKLEKINMVKSSKLRRLKKVGTSQHDTEVQEAIEIVTTAKLMTAVVTAAATQVVAASIPILAGKPKILNIAAALADKDDDVFVEATPLAQKVPVMDYEIVVIENKP